ncbi:MAG: hypothetical protein E5V25_01230 [Mesorhizobium sp.]|uniref:hypothetical protein n=1 Tax=unclassified Mesorhizobium TaxID=325217 RepID=UPI000FEA7127|nr:MULTISPECIES: hypothetical protein [unclassified Mesorhizobium]RWC24232.1 MAG: hypothetical protein EOS51_04625 [Mesorhizobium sp.]RWD85460.1 MAG: hypothetical protein EOS48_05055 [Mesorhizobium sp.]RWE53219.1 MAG: hypothetical protein EOS67_28245 [Mesorhizobium sp.]RWF01070.1 MAG: hypothetical protein EOS68_08695 [Mesorhizobium sp.]RWF55015.1 MAG: hypothetical protein EOS50_15560 [Mesorhizobium sp.]
MKRAWVIGSPCWIPAVTHAFAQAPLAPAQLTNSDFISSLGAYLGYGVIGLGLAVAVLAVVVLISGAESALTAGTRFMLFALTLVFTGVCIEVVKVLAANAEAERKEVALRILPDEFMKSFLDATKRELFRDAPQTRHDDTFPMRKDESVVQHITLPPGECRFYFVVTRPPGIVAVNVDKKWIHERHVGKGFYQTGLICAPTDISSTDAPIEAKLTVIDSKVDMLSFIAPPLKVQPFSKADPVSPSEREQDLSKVVCTGEHEPNCAGPHDLFVACGSQSDKEIAGEVCRALGKVNASALRTHTKGGNRCGYAMIQVTCS